MSEHNKYIYKLDNGRQWCSGAGTHRNAVPVVIRPPRRNAIAAAFRQMFAVKIGFAYSEIRPCLMQFALLNDAALIAIPPMQNCHNYKPPFQPTVCQYPR